MQHLLDQDAREERHVKDYFLAAFRSNSAAASQVDQQFARPIEDEDLFGFDVQISQELRNNDSPKQMNEIPSQDTNRHDDHDKQNEENRDISSDKQTNGQTQPAKQPPPPSPAQAKRQLIKQQIARQVREMGLTPKIIGTGFDENAEIEVRIQQGVPLPDSNVFEKIFIKAKKSALSPECDKKQQSREAHREALTKRICSQKRKVWESFQPKLNEFADEEDIIEGRSEHDIVNNGGEEEEGAFDIEKSIMSDASEDKERQSDVDDNLDKESDAGSRDEFPYGDEKSEADEESNEDSLAGADLLDELLDSDQESNVNDDQDNDSDDDEGHDDELDVYIDREAEVDGDEAEEEDALLQSSSDEEEYSANNFLRLDDEEDEEAVNSRPQVKSRRHVIIDDEDEE